MHFVQAKKILSNKNGLNIYRGCQHGCIYCDARSKCYQMNHSFTDIEVKENAIELLDIELSKKRNKVIVGTGAMSDPYMPLEKELMMTRRMLEVINKHRCGVSILTKSDLVLRDLDLLIEISKHSKVVVAMTLTTIDEDLCKIVEPNVCTTKQRIEVLRILKENGIGIGVWLCPFLPYINDTKENFVSLLKESVDLKVSFIMCFSIGLTLREGNREYFYEQLDKYFIGLKERYILEYKENYVIDSKNNNELMKIFVGICKKYSIMYDTNEIFKYLGKYESKIKQISLFD